MAITVDGNGGTGVSTSSDTTLAFAPTVTLEVGKVVLCAVALDNTTTTDGTTSEISGIADTGSNTWAFLGAFRNGNAGAAAGAQVELWKSKITTQLTTGSTVTITFANTITSKAATLLEVSVGSGNSLQSAGTIQTLAEDADANPASMAHTSLSNKEYLFIRAIAVEGRNNTFASPTSSYTALELAEADSGSAATSMQVMGEYRILTGTGDTSDPGSIGGNGDCANLFFALEEYAFGGTAYSLDAAAGSYAITGAAMSPIAAMLMNAEVGAYAITGANATLSYGVSLNAEAGAYAVVGADASLPAALLFNAEAGSYAITGADATLSLGVSLNAEAGVYTITGEDAALVAAMLLNTEAGTYTITGADAELVAESAGSYSLDAEAGSYLITGEDADLPAAFLLNAAAGSYTIIGADAELLFVDAGGGGDNPGGRYIILRRRRR